MMKEKGNFYKVLLTMYFFSLVFNCLHIAIHLKLHWLPANLLCMTLSISIHIEVEVLVRREFHLMRRTENGLSRSKFFFEWQKLRNSG